MDALDDPASLDGDHLIEQALCALGRSAAQVALATLCAHQQPGPSQAKTLGGRLMGLYLVFPGCLFARHSLGTPCLFLFCHPARSQHHQHRPPVQGGGLFDGGNIG